MRRYPTHAYVFDVSKAIYSIGVNARLKIMCNKSDSNKARVAVN